MGMALPDWLDLAHYYLATTPPPSDEEARLDKLLTGPLGQFDRPHRPAPPPMLRPPRWATISQDDIDRMNRYRNQPTTST